MNEGKYFQQAGKGIMLFLVFLRPAWDTPLKCSSCAGVHGVGQMTVFMDMAGSSLTVFSPGDA